LTAVGGDLGSIGINPAGSAVAGYGQFAITPGLTISSVSSAYSPEGENAYGVPNKMSATRMNLPNVGFTMNYRTGRRSGVKSLTFGILSTQTNNYNFASDGFGSNSQTSKLAEFANAADGGHRIAHRHAPGRAEVVVLAEGDGVIHILCAGHRRCGQECRCKDYSFHRFHFFQV
jgi:hypothetical protein